MFSIGYSTWSGSWKEGRGTIYTESKTIENQSYSYGSRFEGAPGANPEELMAAAHAGCFNQALANNFGMKNLNAKSIITAVKIEGGVGEDGHPAILRIHISVDAVVPSATEEQFQYCEERARSHCTISKIMKCEITLSAHLLV